jgi:hypothetical protein
MTSAVDTLSWQHPKARPRILPAVGVRGRKLEQPRPKPWDEVESANIDASLRFNPSRSIAMYGYTVRNKAVSQVGASVR